MLTHEAEAGTNTPTLLARSRHASVRSFERYARPGPDALAAHMSATDPAARRRGRREHLDLAVLLRAHLGRLPGPLRPRVTRSAGSLAGRTGSSSPPPLSPLPLSVSVPRTEGRTAADQHLATARQVSGVFRSHPFLTGTPASEGGGEGAATVALLVTAIGGVAVALGGVAALLRASVVWSRRHLPEDPEAAAGDDGGTAG
jgi:hypothetical protein